MVKYIMERRILWIEPLSQSDEGISWRWLCSCGETNIEEKIPTRGNLPEQVIPLKIICSGCKQNYVSDSEHGVVNFGINVLID